jgi:hypothetical protein
VTTIEITMPRDAAEFVSRLAPLLHPDDDDPLAKLLQDALRTYLWIVRQQLDDRRVVSISRETKAYLESAQDAPDDAEASVLVAYVPDGAIEQVRAELADPAASAGTTED